MLVLTRQVGERLFIGDDVKLTVLGTENKICRLGIEAPKEVLLLRSELEKRDEK